MLINVIARLKKLKPKKKRAKQKKIPYVYDRKWRDKNENEAPKDVKPVIRFKSKIDGTSILKDKVQGNVEIENNTIEDFVILRNDGTPTYNLSACLLYTSPSPRDISGSRMPSSA